MPLRFSHNARNHARFFGEDWRPAVASLPTIEMNLGFDGQKFGQGALPQVGALIVALREDDDWPALVWKGAGCTIREAPLPADGLVDPVEADFGPPMPFLVDRIQANEGAATLTLVDVGRRLDRPLIDRRFGSSGVGLLDGPDTVDIRGRPVPIGWGVLRSVPGVLVDRLDNIWLFLDRPATGAPDFFDGGAPYSPGVARASLAQLKATAPAQGCVDYCLDAGGLFLARPWTAPAYPFTADLTADGPQAAADIAAAIVAARSGPPFAAGTVAAFAALHPEPCGIYIDDERTIGTALDQLVAGLGGYWRLNSQGEIVLGRLAPAAPVQTFGPGRIVSMRREDVLMPTRRRGIGWGRNNRVHSEGEIAGILLVDWADITGPGKPQDGATRNVDRGSWAALAIGTGFLIGDEVQDQGSTWGALADHVKTAGNGPPSLPATENATWRLRARAGEEGTPGSPGLSVAEFSIFRRAASAPSTPSGGSFDFGSQALTPPSSWSNGIPSGTDPVWVSRGIASVVGQTGSATPSWGAPALGFQDGSDGDDGADGQAVDVVFRRAESQPSAPSPSAGVPSGWYGDVASVPAGAGLIWAAWGERANPSANWAWQTPVLIEGEPGEPGPEGLTGGGQASFEVACTASGVVIGGQLPQTRQLRLFRGATELTTTATWSISGVSGGTISVGAATGVVTLSAITADLATATVTATIGGASLSFPVSARKVRDGAAAVGAAFDVLFPSSTSAAQIGSSSEIALPADMALQLHLNATWEAAAGTVLCEFWFQVRVNGGAWSTVGSAESGSAISGEPAFVTLSRTLAAASNARIVEVRVMATNSNQAQTINASAGPAAAQGVPA
ncbi:MAG: hypothetical protein ACK4Z0_08930 [Sphingomonadaceae bacterium]